MAIAPAMLKKPLTENPITLDFCKWLHASFDALVEESKQKSLTDRISDFIVNRTDER